jgi:hypothetical protein
MTKQPQTRNTSSQHSDRSWANSLAIYGQLALGMAIFGSGTPISKIVTNAFPVFVASGLRVAVATLVLTTQINVVQLLLK